MKPRETYSTAPTELGPRRVPRDVLRREKDGSEGLESLLPEERLGPYRVLEPLGEGGMGEVFRAEQTEPLRRTVALKVLRPGRLGTKATVRFELEGQTLARMSHPNVAQVYDAGCADGRHYLAMELIEGHRLDDWADLHRLEVGERCRLMLQVCAGVEHAHRRGILHRDLKPSNLLVRETGDGPVVKVIDFGIAKAAENETDLTRDGLLGTPAYMSPEQIEGSADLDTRSDVYSLGLVLYRLLTGRGPWDDESLSQIARRASGEEVPLPSTRSGDRDAADLRRTDPSRLRSDLQGDLDAIVAKSLACDREARYGSAADLADDLRRFLEHRPVRARRGTTWYRFRKAVRRHRGRALAAALVVLSLSAGAVGTVAGLVRSRQAEARLAEEAETVRAINGFLQDMLTAADPGVLGREVQVRDVLEQAEGQLSALNDRPGLEAEVRATLARTWLALGDLERADIHVVRALDLMGREQRLETAAGRSVRLLRAEVLAGQARRDEARAEAESLLAELELAAAPTEPSILQVRLVLGGVLLDGGDLAEGLALMRSTVAEATPSEEGYGQARGMLNRALVESGKYEEAEVEARETLAALTRERGEEHPTTLAARNTLAGTLWFQKRFDELGETMEETLILYRRVLGEDHPYSLDVANNLAAVRNVLGDREGARDLTLDTLERRRRLLGPEHPRTLDSMSNLADFLSDGSAERDAEALRLYEEAWSVGERVLGPRHPHRMRVGSRLASHLESLGETGRAEEVLAEVVAGRTEVLGPEHPETLESVEALAALREGSVADGPGGVPSDGLGAG